MNNVEFKAWPKIGRENPFSVTITEKIDGTNACVIIENGEVVGAQSRKRLINIENDNYGFAGWVEKHKDELTGLGDGYHYGEWAGLGIQKNPHDLSRKHFFLFNTYRWSEANKPDCCDVVPVLFEGDLTPGRVPMLLEILEDHGSTVLDETGTSEGVIVYHHALRGYTKHTINSPDGKWCRD